MNDEIEATFKNIDKEKVRKKLEQVAARLVKPEFLQKRVVFNIPVPEIELPQMPKIVEEKGNYFIAFSDGKYVGVSDHAEAQKILETIYSDDIRSRENKGWLRVRDEADRITMTYKRQDSSEITGMRELEIEVDDFKSAFELLQFLGCEYKAYQETKRELWELGDVQITIDEWPFLEPFVEVEGHDEKSVRDVSTKLDFNWETAYFGAVDELYAEKYGVSKRRINEETPEILFDGQNPFLS